MTNRPSTILQLNYLHSCSANRTLYHVDDNRNRSDSDDPAV